MSSAAAVIEASERINEVHIEGLVSRQLLLNLELSLIVIILVVLWQNGFFFTYRRLCWK